MRSFLLFISLLLSLILHINAVAQRPDRLEAITPQAAELVKSLSFPVSLVTGTPEISLPIFSIRSGDIEVPVSISYRASGIKVSESSGVLGLGWSLSAEPLVNRIIYGPADETTSGYKNYSPNFYSIDNVILTSYLKGTRDGQPDEFYYSLLGASGSFMLKKPDYVNDLQFLMFPKKKMQIVSSSTFDTLQITDENGIFYKFDQLETTQSDASMFFNRTGWKPSMVKSTRTGHTIQFSYVPQTETQRTFGTTAYVESYPNFGGPFNCGGSAASLSSYDLLKVSPIVQYYSDPFGTSTYYVKRSQPSPFPGMPAANEWVSIPDQNLGSAPGQFTRTNKKQISEITFEGGKVAFTYGERDKCTDISVYSLVNNSYKLIKRIAFRYNKEASFWATNKTEFLLKKVVYYNSTSTDSLVYEFNYDREGSGVLSSADAVKGIDYWGYYNGMANTDLLPRQKIYKYFSHPGDSQAFLDSLVIGNADRSSNMNATLLTLTEIHYPTGGYSKYQYELNKYIYMGTVTDGGGLRIQKITAFSRNGEIAQEKVYKYGKGESGYGYARRPIRMEDFTERVNLRYIKSAYCGAENTCHKYLDIYNSFPRFDLQFRNSAAVMYSNVTEYIGTENNNTGKIEYTYNLPGDIFVYMNMPYRDAYYTQYGKLIDKKTYKATKNATGSLEYTLINKESNQYLFDITYDNFCAIRQVKQLNRYLPSITSTQCPNPDLIFSAQDVNIYDSQYYDYITYLISSEKTDYSGNDSIVRKEFYEYNQKNYQPSIIKTTNSLKDTLITKIKYSADFDGLLSGAISQMRNMNILTPEIERSLFRKSVSGTTEHLLSSTFNSYENNTIHPDKIYKIQEPAPLTNFAPSSSQSGAIVKDARYIPWRHIDKNDAFGNILQWHSDGNIPNSYTWDYNKQYFSAEVKGAAWNDIAYTSFEADQDGNWSIPSTARNTTTAITGKNSFDLSAAGAAGITKSGLNTSKGYLVSYWTSNNTPYSITGTQGNPAKGKTSGGWTYYEHKITGVSTLTLTGSGLIDELRFYPQNAEMTTYTYDPLVGMTAQCNSKSEITYYEYDTFGRLKQVRDLDGKILKQLDYQYQQSIAQ